MVRLATIGVAAAVAGAAAATPPVEQNAPEVQAPPHLVIFAGEIAEPYPTDPGAPLGPVATRPVTFSLDLAGRPPCSATSSTASYRFLVDLDGVPAAGRTIGVAPEISTDAQVLARCDAVRGAFTSALGTVRTIDLPGGGARLEIVVPAGRLPALKFRWIALAIDNDRFSRIPGAGGFATWAIAEMAPW